MTGKRDLGELIVIFLLMIVGLALAPTVQEQVNNVTGVGGDNFTGAALAIAKLVPLFYVLIVIGIGVAGIVTWLKGT